MARTTAPGKMGCEQAISMDALSNGAVVSRVEPGTFPLLLQNRAPPTRRHPSSPPPPPARLGRVDPKLRWRRACYWHCMWHVELQPTQPDMTLWRLPCDFAESLPPPIPRLVDLASPVFVGWKADEDVSAAHFLMAGHKTAAARSKGKTKRAEPRPSICKWENWVRVLVYAARTLRLYI